MKEIGLLLKQARESQGKSLENISAQTKIQLPLLQSLENGEFGRVTNKAFLKGFLRQYAKTLNLNADDLLATYDRSLVGTVEPKPASVSKLDSNELTDKTNLLWFRAPSQFITLGAVIIIIVLITAIYFISMKIMSYSQESITAESTALPVIEPSESSSAGALIETQPQIAETTPPPSPSESSSSSETTPSDVNSEEDEESEKPKAASTVTPAIENKQKMVTIEAKKDVTIDASWSTGKKETVKLAANNKHVFYYLEKIKVVIDDGGGIKIQTHEKSLGIPGESGKPITINFN